MPLRAFIVFNEVTLNLLKQTSGGKWVLMPLRAFIVFNFIARCRELDIVVGVLMPLRAFIVFNEFKFHDFGDQVTAS